MNEFKVGDTVSYNSLIWIVIETNELENELYGRVEQNINIELLNSNKKLNTWIFSRYAKRRNINWEA